MTDPFSCGLWWIDLIMFEMNDQYFYAYSLVEVQHKVLVPSWMHRRCSLVERLSFPSVALFS